MTVKKYLEGIEDFENRTIVVAGATSHRFSVTLSLRK